MSNVIVTWHDWVRLALYAAQIIIALTMVRLVVIRMRWRSFWTNPDIWIYLAVILLLFTSIRARAQALGSGPFPEGWPTYLTALATVFVMIWLALKVEVTLPGFRSRERARVRRGRARAQRQAEKRVARRHAAR